MMSLWDALRMNMMISYQELVRTFPKRRERLQQMGKKPDQDLFPPPSASINYEPPEGSDGQLIIEAKRKLQKNVNSASQ